MKKSFTLFTGIGCLTLLFAGAQQSGWQTAHGAQNDALRGMSHKKSKSYIYPKEPEVLKQLDNWQDLKFGVLISWGLYNELPGVSIGSWALCSEDHDWINSHRKVPYDEFKRNYRALINKFNPVRFAPEAWAESFKQGGVKYMIFMTKHHDGFCLWDTRQTDFSIAHGAFRDNPRRDLVKETLNAFRKENFMVGAYFSKPDWFCSYYWWDFFATPGRNVNYNVKKYPERWKKFKEYTHNQIEELTNGGYGKIDILWLDGGWVRPPHQDIDMPKIARTARKYQPGLLIVDRTVAGEYENYQTPEQEVSGAQLETPWESCITLGSAWEHLPGDTYKSGAKVIHTLVEITAKGGNLLLGVGPAKDGTMPSEVVARLKEVGDWLKQNGEAIYNTRITRYYRDKSTWFTQSKDGKKIYAIVCLPEGKKIPAKITWKGHEPARGGKLICLQTGKDVRWEKTAEGIEVSLPADLPEDLPAVAFEMNK
jgi:alpha-L-fucosidase